MHHYLTARQQWGDQAARFIAMIVQRSQVAAVVLADGPITTARDLDGRPVAVERDTTHGAEFLHSLVVIGVRPVAIEMPQEQARSALRTGDVHAYVGYIDTLPGSRRLVGEPVRSVPVGQAVYASGLLAGDAVSTDVVARMRAALLDTLRAQCGRPQRGLEAMLARHPDTDPDTAASGWSLLEPLVFETPPGEMTADKWARTVTFLAEARGLEAPPADDLYRPDFAAPAARNPVATSL